MARTQVAQAAVAKNGGDEYTRSRAGRCGPESDGGVLALEGPDTGCLVDAPHGRVRRWPRVEAISGGRSHAIPDLNSARSGRCSQHDPRSVDIPTRARRPTRDFSSAARTGGAM